ncbi:facilitated trehalose transporter Tret1-like [Agrilus planipennis]|uniref:Facilitated trehalose transporter Tret1-like n=1 Tax=Agrilus planipennis TaxID=224129 RepID=A0A1W4WVK3_AGRPL|nr:facilitated trehalose transporter Tret1-like [Agrilus planipennis]
MEQKKKTNSNEIPDSAFRQYLAAVLATLGALAMGTTLSWTSPALPLLQDPASPLPVTNEQGSWIASLLTLGAFMGAIPAGEIAIYLGPKRTLQLTTIPFIVTWITIAYSPNVILLYIARLVAGLVVGLICVAAPMYITDLAEPRIRGSLGGFFQLQVTIGLLVEYILGSVEKSFTYLALISAILPALHLITFSFMPESPVYLTAKGKIDDARKSLQWFRGKSYDVEDELFRIHESITEAARNKAGLSDLIRSKAASKALVISLALMLFQQLSGVNAVLFYAEKIFKDSGSKMSPNMCAIFIGTMQVVATYVSTLLVDRAGRKILLIISSSVMAVCSCSLGIYFYLKTITDVSNLSFLPLISLTIFIIVFSIGFGPIPWMISGELFTPEFKGRACSIAAAFNWTLAFAVTKLFSTLVQCFGAGITFGIFSAISFFGAVFCIIVVPETKGKTMEEVQVLLGGSATLNDVENQKPIITLQNKTGDSTVRNEK